MKVKSLLAFLKRIKYIRGVFNVYKDKMIKGNYIMHSNFRTLILDDSKTLEYANSYFVSPNVSSRMNSIANKVNKIKCFVNKAKRTTAEFEALYTSNNFDEVREIKLFSFENKKILTICTSIEEKNKQIEQYNMFKDLYNLPTIKNTNYHPNAYEVSMVLLKESPGEKATLSSICRAVVAANTSPNKLKKIKAEKLVQFEYDKETNQLLDGLCHQLNNTVLNMELPICIQHGDLSKQNLLYGMVDDKQDFWWIDWEHIKERVFFYDFFFYIMNSALYINTDAYYLYMNGEMDYELKRLFEHFELTFEPEKRKDYFLIFAVTFLKERVCDSGNISTLAKYCQFIETH